MTGALLDPQLQALYEANPELLRPDAPPRSAKVPAWYDNSVVELAGAFLVLRGLVSVWLARQAAPRPGQAAEVAYRGYELQSPLWLRFAVPALQQAYQAGRVTGLSPEEIDALARSYAGDLGEYLNQSSADALAGGFEAQLGGGWHPDVAWARVSTAYGADRPGMRTFIGAVTRPSPQGSDGILPTAARMLVDRLLIGRADEMARNEIWTASQTGQAIGWMYQQRQGILPMDARKRWHSREAACPICRPMDGQAVALDQPFLTPGGQQLIAPAAHPGCLCEAVLEAPDSEISKDLRDDPYDRDKKGRFADREYRTRDVTYMADAAERNPEVKALLDQLKEVEQVNPFGVRTAPPQANPFGRAGGTNPFGGNPFGDRGGNPFGVKANPFAKPKSPAGANPFERKRRQQQRQKRRLIIHRIHQPAKSAADLDVDLNNPGTNFYMPVSAYLEANGFEDDGGYLVHPGDHFDFTDSAEQEAAISYHEGSMRGDLAAEFERTHPHLVDLGAVMTPEHDVETPTPSRMPAGYGLVAIHTEDPWRDVMPNIEDYAEYADLDSDEVRQAWQAILRQAYPLWHQVMSAPDEYVDRLGTRDLRDVYELAGFEPDEDEFTARSRIVYACNQYGVGDGSLAAAFCDHLVWTKPESLGPDGEKLGELLYDAEHRDLPSMTDGGRELAPQQVLAFDRGFHPGTEDWGRRGDAKVHADYTTHHILYRSAIGDKGTNAPPFIPGMREASLWPSDSKGHFLHGGPYPEP